MGHIRVSSYGAHPVTSIVSKVSIMRSLMSTKGTVALLNHRTLGRRSLTDLWDSLGTPLVQLKRGAVGDQVAARFEQGTEAQV